MKRILILTSIGSVLIFFQSMAQNSETSNIVGINHFIDSEILGEQRTIQIYLPPSYTETEEKYPVLYLLDGQLFFNHAVSLSNKFKQARLTPEFIIVGITTSYPQRFSHFSNERDKFIEFMKEELIPYVEGSVRTDNEKLLFGWEYAGSLGFTIMLNNSIAFDGYLLASPFPIWEQIEELDSKSTIDAMLFFTSIGPDEYSVYHGTDKLHSWLVSKKISGLEWFYTELTNEEHHSTGYPTLYHGLRRYFNYYPEFQEDVFKKFIEAGGLDHAYTYAEKRANKYGFSPDLSSWSKYTIIRSAIRANDYGHFNTYVNEFLTDDLIIDLKYRAFDIADFYEQKEDYNKAIEIYKMLLEELSRSEDLLNRIGNAYMSLNNTTEAQKYLGQTASEVSKNKN